MTIAKADILTFADAAMGNTESGSTYSGSDLDVPIHLALQDLAKMHCLKAEDTAQSLTSSSYYLAYPSAALSTEQAIISVVLTDASSVRGAPLRTIPGGWYEYNRLMQNVSSATRGVPKWRVCQDRKIYLYPAPNDTYTASIWHFKRHRALASGVEFPDEYDMAVKFGTLYYLHLLNKDTEGLALWGPQYAQERERMRLQIPRDLGMIGS